MTETTKTQTQSRMDHYCPRYGYIKADYDRNSWLTYLRGSKRTAMNLAIDRHNDVVAEQMDAFKERFAPHYDEIDTAMRMAADRYHSDMREAEDRYKRSLSKLMRSMLTKPERKRFAGLTGRYWNTDPTYVLDDMWRIVITPIIDKLRAFRASMDPHNPKPKPKTQPTTPTEKTEALRAQAVSKLVAQYTSSLED